MDGSVDNQRVFGSCRYMNKVKMTLPGGEVVFSKTPVMSLVTWLGLIKMKDLPLAKIDGGRHVNIGCVIDFEMVLNDHYKEGDK